MGKKREAALFPAPGAEPEPHHFSDYGFDPQLLRFFSQHEAKRPWGRRHHQPPPAQSKPLESARFKLQKPIAKKHHHHLQKKHQQQQQRRRWWSSAASAALLLFKRRSSTRPAPTAAPSPSTSYRSAASTTVPLYLADDDAGGDDDDGPASCACWAPAVRPGRLAAAELGVVAVALPYVSLRSSSLGGSGEGGAPTMPIYLVT